MFSRALGARHAGRHKRACQLRRANAAVAFLIVALMAVVVSGVTILASRSPQWPAAIVTDCAMPAYKTERPSCADNFAPRPATPPFRGATAPPNALALQH